MDDQNLDIKNKGVAILMNRMDSHPEEFTERRNLGARTRWDWLIEQVSRRVFNGHKSDSNYRLDLPFLTDAEVDALYDKYQQTQGQAFTNRIMSELLDEPEAKPDPSPRKHLLTKMDMERLQAIKASTKTQTTGR
jgi:hypothetical protein